MNYLDYVPKLLAAIAAAALSMTIVHDWGYFQSIGSEFQMLQSPYDYLANSLSWLPFTLTAMVIYNAIAFAASWFVVKRSLGREPTEKQLQDLHNKTDRIFKPAAFFTLFVASPACLLIYFIHSPWVAYIALAVVTFGIASVLVLTRSAGVPAHVRLLGVTILMFYGVSYIWGITSGRLALTGFQDVYHFVQKDGGDHAYKLLRNLDKGALVHDPVRQRVLFLKWDQIDRMERFVPLKTDLPWACRRFELFCSHPAVL